MPLTRPARVLVLLALVPALLSAAEAAPQPAARAARYVPRFEAVAETRLLMEGLNQSNYRGLERLLKEKPADAETWSFARGQALLIAETGNLLLLRPPRTPEGQDAWFLRATELREAAAALARNTGSRDHDASRAGLATVANACNRCHQTFRVAVRVGPKAAEAPGDRPRQGPGI